MINIGILLLAYIVGLFPSAYLYSRLFKKVDVRTMGTGNMGGMNTLVHIGILPGILTILTDVAKGYFVVHLALQYGTLQSLGLLALFMLILSHNYNPLLNFNGGKGFANLIGGLLLISPIVIPLSIGTTILLLPIIKVPRVTAGAAVLTLPFYLYWQSGQVYQFTVGFAVMALIFSKHIHNFKWYYYERHEVNNAS